MNTKKISFGLLKATNAVLSAKSESEGFGRALKILGEATKVDRVYICKHFVEKYTNEMYFSLLYEWTSDFSIQQINSSDFKRISYSRFSSINFYEKLSDSQSLKLLLKNFTVDLKSIFLEEKVKSTIILPIIVGEKYWGFMGYEDIKEDKVWTEVEEAILVKMASNIAYIIKEWNEKSRTLIDENYNPTIINEENIFSLFNFDNVPDFNFFVSLLEIYLRDIPNMTLKIDTSIEQKNYSNLKFYSHKLGGSLLNLGAESVIGLCHQLEQAGKENIIDESVTEINQTLKKQVKKILTELTFLREKYIKFV